MKKLNLIAAAILFASAGAQAAGTAQDTFDVSVNFTAGCSVQTASLDYSFNYTAFGAAQSKSGSTVFKCSRGLTPTFSFDNTPGGAQTGSSAVALNSPVTAEGVIKGIRYTISGATSKSQSGTSATAGANGTGGSDGTADLYTIGLSVDIAADQAGDNTSGSGTQTRTLTITY